MDYIWLISVPLVAGVLIYAAWILGGRKSPAGLGRVASVVAIVAVAWTLWQAIGMFQSPPPPSPPGGPIDLGPLTLALRFRADGLSTLIVLAASGIALMVTLYSYRAMAGHDRAPVYYAWVLWTVSAVTAAALANTFLILILAWEVATVLLYLLIGLGQPQSRAGAMKTFAILGFADLCLLLGVMLLFQAQGGGNALLLVGGEGAPGPAGTDRALTVVAYLLMAAAALAKAGAMPLHTWIPAASEHAPTTVFALLPAALDKLLGIYLLARITFEVFAVNAYLAGVLMVIGAGTILFAVMMAMVQHNLKRLLAFHAVSQVGYMVLGMALAASILAAGRAAGGLTAVQQGVATIAFCGGLLHMLNNAVYKCCLFLVAGSAERVAGTTDLDRLGGLARMLPVTFVCCIIAALSISGVPPMNGFVSKWLVYHGALGAGSGLATVCLVTAVFGSALTLASFIKVLHSVFLGTKGSAVPAGDEGRESPTMAIAMAVLALACVFLGVWGGLAVDRLILPAAGAVGFQRVGITATPWALELGGAKATGLWAPSTASTLIVVGVALGFLLYLYARAMRVRVVPNFVGGEDTSSDAIWHVSGTGFYETIRRLPALSWAFGDASAGAFDVYRLAGLYGNVLVQRLRGWHTGLAGVYASWAIIGLVVLVVVLALR
ncbi:MAG: hypothetical protein AMK73_08545 [Planctomycetes bacterium SM23_32]|nr:MAG: hypothetical protein AMK73_08545 [Planctomycetes bacterium SM23_32]